MIVIVNKIAVMFIMMAIGFLLGKLRIITDDGNKVLSNLSLLLVSPLLTFVSYQREYSSAIAKNLVWALGLTVVSYIVQIGISFAVTGKKRDGRAVERMALIFSNCGYVGIPLVQSIYGNDGVIFLTMYIAVFYVLTWTLGVSLMTGKTSFRQTLKNLCTPAVIAVVLGIVCFFARIKLPALLYEPINAIGEMNTPLAMLIAGATLAGTNIVKCLTSLRMYFLSAMRLLIIPLACAAVLFCASFAGAPHSILTIVLIATSCPSAVITTMFAHRYGGDTVLASQTFAVSTILSALTIPLVLWLFSLTGVSITA